MSGTPDPRPILTRALESARERSPLAAELQRAQRDFFGGSMPTYASDPQSLAAAESRFAEWFLLERTADTLGTPPTDLIEEDHREWLAASVAGVFLVERAAGADRAVVRDLQSDRAIDVDPAACGGDLAPGSLVIGRLYGSDPAWPSPTCVVRGSSSDLARALRADFEALGLQRRLDQAELEQLVFRKFTSEASPVAAEEPLERLEARLETLLTEGGFDEVSAEDVCASLEAADSVGAVAGPLLERVAFHSAVDLAACQELLAKLFDAQRRGRTPAEPETPLEVRPGATPRLGADLVRHLEDGLAGNRDLETVFAEMARMAGIDPAELDEDTDVEPDPDASDRVAPRDAEPFLDLGPLVTEYLWESGDDAGDRRVLEGLVQLTAALPVAVGQFEDLTSEHFLRLMLQGWLMAVPRERVATVVAIRDSLRRFVDWALAEQELDRTDALSACGPAFVDHAERMARAAELLSRGAGQPPTAPALWRVEQVEADFFCVRRDDGDRTAVLAEKTAAGTLQPGDLLVGQVVGDDDAPRFDGIVVVLPAATEGLLA